jgi:hypothetical protein
MRGFGFLVFIFLLGSPFINAGIAQSIEVVAKKSTTKIAEQIGDSYFAEIQFPLKKVKKEFWRFSSQFAKYENLRTHHVLIIPPTSKEENAELKILVKIEGDDLKSKVSTALAAQNMNSEALNNHAELPKNTLREFQIYFYKKLLQEKLLTLEQRINQLSRRNRRNRRLNRSPKTTLTQKVKIQSEIDAVLKEKDAVTRQFSQIK